MLEYNFMFAGVEAGKAGKSGKAGKLIKGWVLIWEYIQIL